MSDTLCPKLNMEELMAALPNAPRQQFEKDTEILSEGHDAGSCFLVTQGSVSVQKNAASAGEPPLHLGTLQVGEFFGEMAMLSGSPRTATTVAATNVETLEISRDAFRQLISDNPSLAANLALHFAVSLANRCAKMNELLAKTPGHPSQQDEPIDPRQVLHEVYALWAI